jgi:hypothetical protein
MRYLSLLMLLCSACEPHQYATYVDGHMHHNGLRTSVYVGCFTDTSTRALPDWLIGSGATVESCIAVGKASGLHYVGLEYGGQCFAGDVLGYTQVADSECSMPCSADPSEICGGVWLNSVYATGL